MIPDSGVTLLLTGVEDGRCPAGADCVWEGMIRVEIAVMTVTQELEQITLCNPCDNATGFATAAGLTFGLVALAPSTEDLANLGRDPLPADYLPDDAPFPSHNILGG